MSMSLKTYAEMHNLKYQGDIQEHKGKNLRTAFADYLYQIWNQDYEKALPTNTKINDNTYRPGWDIAIILSSNPYPDNPFLANMAKKLPHAAAAYHTITKGTIGHNGGYTSPPLVIVCSSDYYRLDEHEKAGNVVIARNIVIKNHYTNSTDYKSAFPTTLGFSGDAFTASPHNLMPDGKTLMDQNISTFCSLVRLFCHEDRVQDKVENYTNQETAKEARVNMPGVTTGYAETKFSVPSGPSTSFLNGWGITSNTRYLYKSIMVGLPKNEIKAYDSFI